MTIRNPFSQPVLKRTFDVAVDMFKTRHRDLFSTSGQPHRLNGYASPFWQGYFKEPGLLVIKGSQGQAMFRAGQACQKAFDVKFQHDGKFVPIGAERHYPQQFPESKSG